MYFRSYLANISIWTYVCMRLADSSLHKYDLEQGQGEW